MASSQPTVTVERDGHVLLMGLNRPPKRNAFNLDMLRELSAAYGLLERDEELRCGVLFGHGHNDRGGPRAVQAPRVAGVGRVQALPGQQRGSDVDQV